MDEELAEIPRRFEKMEQDGKRDILKYFDRIHDKLFTFNNILIRVILLCQKMIIRYPLKL